MAKSYKYRRSRKPLTLDDCKLRLTDAVDRAEEIILTEDTTDNTAIQAIHALSSAINRYAKLVETTELQERVEALEQKLDQQ